MGFNSSFAPIRTSIHVAHNPPGAGTATYECTPGHPGRYSHQKRSVVSSTVSVGLRIRLRSTTLATQLDEGVHSSCAVAFPSGADPAASPSGRRSTVHKGWTL